VALVNPTNISSRPSSASYSSTALASPTSTLSTRFHRRHHDPRVSDHHHAHHRVLRRIRRQKLLLWSTEGKSDPRGGAGCGR